MGCVHSNSYEITPIYPSALYSEVDHEIVEVWNEFLRGNCPAWKALVEAGQTDRKTPAVYWSDDFKNRLVGNIALSRPCISAELESRPIKATARTLCELMKLVLLKTVLDDNESIISSGNKEIDDEVKKAKAALLEAEHKQFVTIARHHIKWQVDDPSYLCVENALMDTLRTCLGSSFLPQYEVRLRYKYGCLKQTLEKVQSKYEKDNPQETLKLKMQGELRIDELQEKRPDIIKEQPERRSALTVTTYSVRDLTNYDPVSQASLSISSRRISSG